MGEKFYLKDWHGKEQEFTDDKIFARGENGELIQFTQGEGESTLEPLEVTENGNYTPGEGVDGFNSVSVNVPDIPAVVQPLEVTENGTYTAPDGVDGFNEVTVAVSGGSSADVRYVTFMSYDGLTEYGKKAVAVGDDCADPIARGIFATPTRESDVQYNYTFYGWATAPNGAADSNWNKAITEDKVVYANFASTVRYYTITYYDSDGTTVLKTESLAYGAMPSTAYIPEKDGYAFTEWQPSLATVTGAASYTAQWIESLDFSNVSWEKIAEKSADGSASSLWKVGNTKNIAYTNTDGTTVQMTVKIIGFNHDDLADGSGKAGITFACLADTLPESIYASGAYNSSQGGPPYGQSTIRTLLEDTIKKSLPAELQGVLKKVKKEVDKYAYVYSSGIDKELHTMDMHLFPFSLGEIGFLTASNDNYLCLGTKYEGLTAEGTSIWNGVWTRNHKHTPSSTSQPIYTYSVQTGTYIKKWETRIGDFGWTDFASNPKKVKFGFCI